MIPLIINNKKLSIPTHWDEITLKQYLRYIDVSGENSVYAILEIFTGIDRASWEDSKEIENFYLIVNALDFLAKKPKLEFKCPDFVYIEDKQVKIPKDIGSHTVKQYEDMRAVMQLALKDADPEDKLPLIKAYPRMIAIYLCAEFGSYSAKNIEETALKVENLSYNQVVGLGNFFLKSFIRLKNGTARSVHRYLTIPKSWMRVLRRWKNGDS